MASIQAEVTVPSVDDDPENHKFKWGDSRTLYFIIKVDGASGGELVTVNIHNEKDKGNHTLDVQAAGTLGKGGDGSFGAVVTFEPDGPFRIKNQYHLGTGPDQSLTATATATASTVTGLPAPYGYTTV